MLTHQKITWETTQKKKLKITLEHGSRQETEWMYERRRKKKSLD